MDSANGEAPEVSLTRRLGHFRKVSSVENSVDPGNKIVAIRRMTLVVDDFDRNHDPIKRKINYVEVELLSDISPPIVNSSYVVRIGSKEFLPGGRGCGTDPRCVMVVMKPEEFDALYDGDLISMRNGAGATPEQLTEMFDHGEPATVVGAKFGRLRKSVIDNFPPIERTATDY